MSKTTPLEELLKTEAFQNLDPELIESAKQTCKNLQGKSDNEMMQGFMQFMAMHKDSARQLTPKQRQAIIYALRETLEPRKRKKFDAVIQMMQIMSRK